VAATAFLDVIRIVPRAVWGKEALERLAALVIAKENAVGINVVEYHQPLPVAPV
jgi:hypothetical protein